MVSDCEVPSRRSPLPACKGQKKLLAIVSSVSRACGANWTPRVVGVLAFVQQSLDPCLQRGEEQHIFRDFPASSGRTGEGNRHTAVHSERPYATGIQPT